MSALLNHWIIAAVVLAASFLVGLFVDAAITRALLHDAGPARRGRRAVADALRWLPEVWAVLIGIGIFRPFAFLPDHTEYVIGKISVIVATIAVTLFFARLAGSLIRAYLSLDSVTAPSGSIFANLARLVIWAVGLTFVLGALGVEIGPLVASLGVVGLAVSLGLQDTLANFFSGLQITVSRQIQPGQYIRLASGEEGAIVDVTWRNTTVCAPSNDLVMVPNSVIARSLITNYTADDEEHTCTIPFTVAYGSNLDQVREIALRVAHEVRDSSDVTVPSFEPACRFKGMTAEGVSAIVTLRVKRYQDRLPVVSALVEKLYRELAAARIAPAVGPTALAAAPEEAD